GQQFKTTFTGWTTINSFNLLFSSNNRTTQRTQPPSLLIGVRVVSAFLITDTPSNAVIEIRRHDRPRDLHMTFLVVFLDVTGVSPRSVVNHRHSTNRTNHSTTFSRKPAPLGGG